MPPSQGQLKTACDGPAPASLLQLCIHRCTRSPQRPRAVHSTPWVSRVEEQGCKERRSAAEPESAQNSAQ